MVCAEHLARCPATIQALTRSDSSDPRPLQQHLRSVLPLAHPNRDKSVRVRKYACVFPMTDLNVIREDSPLTPSDPVSWLIGGPGPHAHLLTIGLRRIPRLYHVSILPLVPGLPPSLNLPPPPGHMAARDLIHRRLISAGGLHLG